MLYKLFAIATAELVKPKETNGLGKRDLEKAHELASDKLAGEPRKKANDEVDANRLDEKDMELA